MHRNAQFILFAILLLALVGAAEHESGCVPEAANPLTITEVAGLGGDKFYLEERANDPYNRESMPTYGEEPPSFPPPPGWGFSFGRGTYLYEEENGVEGLQRGDHFEPGGCVPPEVMDVCVVPLEDHIFDGNCAHGPDRMWWTSPQY